jgi:hypothetical protein
MPVNPMSESSQFEAWIDDGVLEVDLNARAGMAVSGHLRAAIERHKGLANHVPPSLIAFTETLSAAAELAVKVLAGEAKPTDPDMIDEIIPSAAPVFTITVNKEGVIEIEATTKAGYQVSRAIREYRDWRDSQGFRIPSELHAFGAAIGSLARAGQLVTAMKPVFRLPEERIDPRSSSPLQGGAGPSA